MNRIIRIKTVTYKKFLNATMAKGEIAYVDLPEIPGYAKNESWTTGKPGEVAVKYWNAFDHDNAIYFLLTYAIEPDRDVTEGPGRGPAGVA